nr:sigma-54-dependent Fis family transcriptional regulator [Planctomycetota bacterium]
LDRDGELGLGDLPRTLRPADLPAVEAAPGGPKPDSGAGAGGYRLAGKSLQQVEQDLIAQTLEMTQGNRQQAAVALGMGERTLYRKIKEYEL